MLQHRLEIVQAVRQTNIQYTVIHKGFQWENVINVPIFVFDLVPVLVAFNARLQIGKLVAQNLFGPADFCLLKQLKSSLDHASTFIAERIVQPLGFTILNPSRIGFASSVFAKPIRNLFVSAVSTPIATLEAEEANLGFFSARAPIFQSFFGVLVFLLKQFASVFGEVVLDELKIKRKIAIKALSAF